ncbi:PTPA-CTERM sorting domain-containing protein [Phormidesmis priestleyi]
MTTTTVVRQSILGLIGAACLVVGSQLSAQALTFEGSSSGQFGLPITPGFGSDVFLSNEGGTNSRLNWGTPVSGSFSNFVQFNGSSGFSTPTDATFKVGDLAYRNGSTLNGFDGNFPLSIALNFTNPSGVNQAFNFLFNILNTPNITGNPVLDGDRLRFSTAGLSSGAFNAGGVSYTLQLLGFSPDGGSTIINEFNSPEGTTATADLYGRITAASIPTPALLPGLIGMVAALRKRKAEVVEESSEA